MLKPGLYEQIISQSLSRELASVSDACKHVEKLDAAEAPQALAGYVAEAVRAALEAMPAGTEEQSVPADRAGEQGAGCAVSTAGGSERKVRG